jgi:hypothetical protein
MGEEYDGGGKRGLRVRHARGSEGEQSHTRCWGYKTMRGVSAISARYELAYALADFGEVYDGGDKRVVRATCTIAHTVHGYMWCEGHLGAARAGACDGGFWGRIRWGG